MSLVKNFYRQHIKPGYKQWLNRRIPPSKEVLLNQRKIFIVPSRFGFSFCGLILLIFLLAVNYQNNMAYMLAFFMASLFFVTLHHSYNNLSGLQLSAQPLQAVHVGDEIVFTVLLNQQLQRERHNIYLKWPLSASQTAALSAQHHVSCSVTLSMVADKRGSYQPGRLLVESDYPLGLFRVWSYVDLDTSAIIYPKPVKASLPSLHTEDKGESYQTKHVSIGDEFYQLRPYQAGDNLKHIHWQQYARSQQLSSKQFAQPVTSAKNLDWYSLAGDMEFKLSVLCYWALEFEQAQQPYSLILPNLTVEKSIGIVHLHRVLSALARFGEQA